MDRRRYVRKGDPYGCMAIMNMIMISKHLKMISTLKTKMMNSN